MTLSIHSKRLFGAAYAPNGATGITTVPAGRRWVIKNVCVSHDAAGLATTFRLYVGAFAAGNVALSYSVANQTTLVLTDLNLVLEAGESFYPWSSAAATLVVTCGGFDFAL